MEPFRKFGISKVIKRSSSVSIRYDSWALSKRYLAQWISELDFQVHLVASNLDSKVTFQLPLSKKLNIDKSEFAKCFVDC